MNAYIHDCIIGEFGGLLTKLCLTLVTPWAVACQDPLSMGFSRQEYWSGLPFPSPGDLPNPRIKPGSPALQEIQVRPLGREDPLEKEMATHSSILAWRIPWTEEPGRLQSMGSQELDTTEQLPLILIPCSQNWCEGQMRYCIYFTHYKIQLTLEQCQV